MKNIAAITGIASLAALAVAGCGSAGSQQAAAPAVTHTVIEPKTQTITAPGPTVTETVYAPVSEQQPSGGSPAPGANKVIVRFNGSGTQNTPPFTTPDRWHLSWAYWGCPSGTSNFAVDEFNADGSADTNGISVNELGTGRGPVATYAYGDAGTHYLSVSTEGCSWSLVPVTG